MVRVTGYGLLVTGYCLVLVLQLVFGLGLYFMISGYWLVLLDTVFWLGYWVLVTNY